MFQNLISHFNQRVMISKVGPDGLRMSHHNCKTDSIHSGFQHYHEICEHRGNPDMM